MATMNGVVEQLGTKDVTTKFGVKPTFSMKVSGTWVKCGFKNPKVNVGDTVEFEGETGTYGLEGTSIRVTAKGSGSVVPTSTGVPSSAGKSYSKSDRVFPIPPLHGDRSIVRQNALARATDLIIASRGGKAFDVDDVVVKVAIHVARGFEAYTAGDLDLAAATAETKASNESLEKGE